MGKRPKERTFAKLQTLHYHIPLPKWLNEAHDELITKDHGAGRR